MIVYSIDEDSIDPYMESFSILIFECEEDAKIEMDRLAEKNKGVTYSIYEWDVLPKGWRHEEKQEEKKETPIADLKMLPDAKFLSLELFKSKWIDKDRT